MTYEVHPPPLHPPPPSLCSLHQPPTAPLPQPETNSSVHYTCFTLCSMFTLTNWASNKCKHSVNLDSITWRAWAVLALAQLDWSVSLLWIFAPWATFNSPKFLVRLGTVKFVVLHEGIFGDSLFVSGLCLCFCRLWVIKFIFYCPLHYSLVLIPYLACITDKIFLSAQKANTCSMTIKSKS